MTYTVPAGYPDPTPYLLPEETLRFVVRRHHPIVLLVPALVTAAVVLVGVWFLGTVALSAGTVVVAALLVGGALLYFGYRWLHWRRTVLVVTNRRLFQLVSLGVQHVTVMPVMRQSIVFQQGPVGRALGFATVQVRSATGGVLYTLKLLGDPAMFRNEVTNIAA